MPDRRKIDINDGQRMYMEAKTDLVIGALDGTWMPFESICEKLHAVSTIFDQGGYPITRAEVMIALHKLVKEGRVLKERSKLMQGVNEYKLAEAS